MKLAGWFSTITAIFLLTCPILKAQVNPREVLDKVQAQFDAIDDYQVSVHLNVDIQNFRMPNKNMRVYFKKPDKIKIRTSGFAIIPRFGLIPTPAAFINDSVRLEYVRSLRENDISYHVIGIHQQKEIKNSPDIFLRINTGRWTIDRMQMEYEKEGTTEINIVYQKVAEFWLPETTTIHFDLESAIPPAERPNIEHPFVGMEQYAGSDSKPVKGYVTITFRNFIINKGLKDAVFEEEEY